MFIKRTIAGEEKGYQVVGRKFYSVFCLKIFFMVKRLGDLRGVFRLTTVDVVTIG